MTTFLLELLSEEIPARMQAQAAADLSRLFAAEIAKAGLVAETIETYATPRRLALIARGLPLATEATAEEVKGPRADAPAQALAGFLGKTGLTRDQLVERADARGNVVLFAMIERTGRATAEVLADAIPAIVRGFPWPKSMRWGAASADSASLRWVRPLKGIVALLDEMVVPFAINGIVAGASTRGHRFHHPGAITIGSADDYVAKLRACHVILDPAERQAIIRAGAAEAAAAAGLTVVPDEGLVAENAGLTEWPVPLLGRFDPAFLEVPREVIQLTMRTNQKYFACVDGEGRLANAFVCTANIAAADGGAGIVAGNRKVLSARLSDARFFWEQDLKVPLEDQAGKLGQIVFHEKLGTVADKVERVAKLARWLVEEGIVKSSPQGGEGDYAQHGGGEPAASTASSLIAPPPSLRDGPPPRAGEDRAHLADLAEQAARLCKADLVTAMVGEFPELQGVMGGYYARAQGLDPQVADAIRDHYKPVGQGDEVPTAPVTVAVSLADKLDTIAAFFAANEKPTGSKDPFAIRRAALATLQLIFANQLRLGLLDLSQQAALSDGSGVPMFNPVLATNQFVSREIRGLRHIELAWDLLDFFADRLKVQQREAGVRHDLIDAVFALGSEDDLVRLLARVHALQAFVTTFDGANLLAGYKRAANILRIEEKRDGAASPAVASAQAGAQGLAPDERRERPEAELRPGDAPEAEAALIAALDAAEPAAERAVAEERFADAMAVLATLRPVIDAFFDQVTVNDPDPATRAARLRLLARMRDAVHRVADFSRIEG